MSKVKLPTAWEIRHLGLAKARQTALAMADEVVCRQGEIAELHKTIENWQGHIQMLESRIETLEAPIPMILFCPICRCRHIDKGKFETEPHKSHACQGCGFVWSPCHRPTVGVEFLPGYRNDV